MQIDTLLVQRSESFRRWMKGLGIYCLLMTAVLIALMVWDYYHAFAPVSRVPLANPPSVLQSDGSYRIDLNTATVEQLQELPRIGPVLAQAIVQYRETHGRFANPEQLMEVSGIGPATFAQCEPLITVGDPNAP